MNYLKANSDKSQLFVTSKDEVSIKVDGTDIKKSSFKLLLGVLIDSKITFNEHVSKLCKQANDKLHAWDRIQNI